MSKNHARNVRDWLLATTAPPSIMVNGVRFTESNIPMPNGDTLDLLGYKDWYEGRRCQVVALVIEGAATENDGLRIIQAMHQLSEIQLSALPAGNEPFDYENIPAVTGLIIAQEIPETLRLGLSGKDVTLWAYTPRESGKYILTLVHTYKVHHEDLAAYSEESCLTDSFWELFEYNKSLGE